MGLHVILHFMKLAANQRNTNRIIFNGFIRIIHDAIAFRGNGFLEENGQQESLTDGSNKHDFRPYDVLCYLLEIRR